MATLYVLSGPDLGRSHELQPGMVLGRGDACEIVLHAASISRQHARIECEGEQWCVVDLDSRNGLFSDDERMARVELRDGALFRLGDLELRFRAAAPAPVKAASPVAASVPEPAPVPEIDEPIEFEAEIQFDEPDADLVGGVEVELEFEEALEAPPPPTATAMPAPAASAAPPRAPEVELSPEARRRRAESMQRAGERVASTSATPGKSAAGVQDAGRPVLKYTHEVERSGFFAADLSQYPLWIRAIAVLLAVGLFAGVFWVAFKGVGSLKQPGGGNVEVIEPE